jgi:hypothetical protein
MEDSNLISTISPSQLIIYLTPELLPYHLIWTQGILQEPLHHELSRLSQRPPRYYAGFHMGQIVAAWNCLMTRLIN